jgi:hypothetical protein
VGKASDTPYRSLLQPDMRFNTMPSASGHVYREPIDGLTIPLVSGREAVIDAPCYRVWWSGEPQARTGFGVVGDDTAKSHFASYRPGELYLAPPLGTLWEGRDEPSRRCPYGTAVSDLC